MTAFELFKQNVIDDLRYFYGDRWSMGAGIEESADFKVEVRNLDPMGKMDVWRGACAWLRKNDAISEADLAAVRELTNVRNKFAHDLSNLLGAGKGPDFEVEFPRLRSLIVKVKVWWLENIEFATDPDFDWDQYETGSAIPGIDMTLSILQAVCLGDDEEAWALYERFSDSIRTNHSFE